jgi:serine/threonine-protein kinase/endoribonuclease IRE1
MAFFIRDLKPANILLASSGRTKAKGTFAPEAPTGEDRFIVRYEKGGYIAKISDMGLGKQLAGQSSFGLSTLGAASIQGSVNGGESSRLVGAGPGSVGWQAPEVMAIRWSAESSSVKSGECNSRTDSLIEASPLDAAMSSRTSRSVDIFSLGCIFHCTLVPGTHPFGDWYEREVNIMRNKASTEELLDLSPDAHDLITAMISRDATQRPTAQEVCEHPFFWSPRKKLAFLCDVSDRIEVDAQLVEQGKEASSRFAANVFAMERNAAQVVGTAWDQSLDPDLISNVSKFRTYDPSSVRDFLRLIRNKHHHYDELPGHVKVRVGPNPDGLLFYFESRFPRLLMHCFRLSKELLDADDPLALKYSIPTTITPRRRLEANQLKSVVYDDCLDNIQVQRQDSNPEVEFRTLESNIQASTDTCGHQEHMYETVDTLNGVDCDYNSLGESPEFQVAAETDQGVDMEHLRWDAIAPILPAGDIVIWDGSTAAKTFKCRGWWRADDEWTRRGDSNLKKLDGNLARCADDSKFRTRLCNHWDSSLGTFCPMQKRNKCIFAHGPVELRVKEGKKTRWGKLVDANGNNSNPKHSGGEDTYGAARSIEATRKEEGKWNTGKLAQGKAKPKANQTSARN